MSGAERNPRRRAPATPPARSDRPRRRNARRTTRDARGARPRPSGGSHRAPAATTRTRSPRASETYPERRLRGRASSRGGGGRRREASIGGGDQRQKRRDARGASEGGARTRTRTRARASARRRTSTRRRGGEGRAARRAGSRRARRRRARTDDARVTRLPSRFSWEATSRPRARASSTRAVHTRGDGGVAFATTDTDAAEAFSASAAAAIFRRRSGGGASRGSSPRGALGSRRGDARGASVTPRARENARGRGGARDVWCTRKIAPPPSGNARASNAKNAVRALVSAGNALKVAYERHRTTSTPRPRRRRRVAMDATLIAVPAETRLGSQTRRRRVGARFGKGARRRERNRRRAMEDEFSGGAGVDVGVSGEGARLLIDPGTGVYGALGADTAPRRTRSSSARKETRRRRRRRRRRRAANVSRRRIPARARTRRLRSRSPSPTFARPRRRTNGERLRVHPRTSPRRTRWTSRRVSSFRPKFYLDGRTVRLPDVDAEASAGKRAAALRAHLRERLGEGKFDAAYRALDELDERDDEDKVVGRLCEVMGRTSRTSDSCISCSCARTEPREKKTRRGEGWEACDRGRMRGRVRERRSFDRSFVLDSIQSRRKVCRRRDETRAAALNRGMYQHLVELSRFRMRRAWNTNCVAAWRGGPKFSVLCPRSLGACVHLFCLRSCSSAVRKRV